MDLKYIIDLEKEIKEAGLFPDCIFYDPENFDVSQIAQVNSTFRLAEELEDTPQIALPIAKHIFAPSPVMVHAKRKNTMFVFFRTCDDGVLVYRKADGTAVYITNSLDGIGKALRTGIPEYSLHSNEQVGEILEPIFGREF